MTLFLADATAYFDGAEWLHSKGRYAPHEWATGGGLETIEDTDLTVRDEMCWRKKRCQAYSESISFGHLNVE